MACKGRFSDNNSEVMINVQFENEVEIATLAKSLLNAKFFVYKYDSWKTAFSPILGNLILKAFDAYNQCCKETNHKPIYLSEQYVEDSHSIMEMLDVHIIDFAKYQDWDDFSYEEKIDLIKNLVFPMKCKDETIQKLLKCGDDQAQISFENRK